MVEGLNGVHDRPLHGQLELVDLDLRGDLVVGVQCGQHLVRGVVRLPGTGGVLAFAHRSSQALPTDSQTVRNLVLTGIWTLFGNICKGFLTGPSEMVAGTRRWRDRPTPVVTYRRPTRRSRKQPQRRERSAAPIRPALLPSRALRISGIGRKPRPTSWPANAVRVGSSSSSSASLTPPPMTTTPGSRISVSDAMPSPSQRPSSASCWRAPSSPSLGGLGDQRPGDLVQVAAGALEHALGDHRAAHRERPRLAHQRRAAGVLLEAAVLAAAAEDAVGHHAHVADLGADAVRAAVDLAVEHQPAADTGADGDQQQVVGVVAGAVTELAPRRGVGVVLDHDRQLDALLELALEVLVAPGDVGREQHDGAGLVDVAGRAHADRLDRRAARAAR